jgi:hypothetical protein
MIASKADGSITLEILDDLENLTRVWAPVDVIAQKDELMRLAATVQLTPVIDAVEKQAELLGHAMNVANGDGQHMGLSAAGQE